MAELQYEDTEIAGLYDTFYPPERRRDFGFYLPYIMRAGAVLDIGCGTGALLGLARERGHTGRLVGLDPGAGMLSVARRRADVEWVHGDLTEARWDREFDFAVMTGNAFQTLVTDAEVRTAFATVRAALRDGGRFGFETRNPAARAWETWTPDSVEEATDADGRTMRVFHTVHDVTDDLVTFTGTYTAGHWPGPRLSTTTLRFLDLPTLDRFLAGAGLTVDERFGDTAGRPITDSSPEIVTISRR